MNKPSRREGFLDDEEVIETQAETNPRRIKPIEPRAAEEQPSTSEEPPAKPDKPAIPPDIKWPFTYKLRYRNLKVGHDLVDELTFREPTAGDILDYGNPCNIEVKQMGKQHLFTINIDDNKMIGVLGNLVTTKNVMEPHLRLLDIRDFQNLANKLRRFFRPDWDMVNF